MKARDLDDSIAADVEKELAKLKRQQKAGPGGAEGGAGQSGSGSQRQSAGSVVIFYLSGSEWCEPKLA